MCHSLFEQYTTEALAGWRGDWRSVKFLPLELEPRLGARALDRPIDRDLAPWPGQCTVLGGIGSELVHDEGEGLRYPGVQPHIGTNSHSSAPAFCRLAEEVRAAYNVARPGLRRDWYAENCE